MAADPRSHERRALLLSLAVTGALGSAALVWGIISGSSVILFDGLYMLAGIVLVAVSLVAARTAETRPTPDYPFGRHGATPLAVCLQGAALLATLVYGASDAVAVIVNGGSGASAGSVVAYGIVSAALSLVVMIFLRGPARHVNRSWRRPNW
ncbi:cation transporter [Gordonia sp. LSe1-13]|uniref:Cation transporter n=1 Tax=Gordonia sesuvii TaxID=3116777 RepID=A0ABU7MEX8_9ACTN|nr:cation transporter [Gordonia sp. LSe1-13]